MNILSFDAWLRADFHVHVINALRQYCAQSRSFSCIGSPKKCHLLTFLFHCDAAYRDKEGNTFSAHSGDVILTAQNAEYEVRFSDFSEGGNTVGINFRIEADHTPLGLDCAILVFRGNADRMGMLFDRAQREDGTGVPPAQKQLTLLHILLSLGAQKENAQGAYALIRPGVEYLREHLEENTDVRHLASLCHISEVYFRRIFLREMKNSPARYRIVQRIGRARQYLEYSDIPIAELSVLLGYADPAYFIRQFREHTGMTPLAYRRNFAR